jgi:hypothetical protein
VQAEVDTGIVLTTDRQRRHRSGDKMYLISASLDSAGAFARQVVSISPRVECAIYDAQQRHIERITPES